MELKVLRQEFTRDSTIGQLLVDGQFECWTLEDRVRPVKVYGETAIPAGRYQVVISMSERFKRRLPLLVDVPEYTGVRIHPGNTKADTLGCILVGQTKSPDAIGRSRLAFDALMPKLEAAARGEKIFIEVMNEGAPLPAERGMPALGGRAAPAEGAGPGAHKAGKKAKKSAKKGAKKGAKNTAKETGKKEDKKAAKKAKKARKKTERQAAGKAAKKSAGKKVAPAVTKKAATARAKKAPAGRSAGRRAAKPAAPASGPAASRPKATKPRAKASAPGPGAVFKRR